MKTQGITSKQKLLDWWRDRGGEVGFIEALDFYMNNSNANCRDQAKFTISKILRGHGQKQGQPKSRMPWKLTNHVTRDPKTKAQRVLEFIRDSGGAMYGDAQQFVWELNGKAGRRTRGYWSSQLSGTWRQAGLLHKFCVQDLKTKKWHIASEISPPFLKHEEGLRAPVHERFQLWMSKNGYPEPEMVECSGGCGNVVEAERWMQNWICIDCMKKGKKTWA